ncbi:MAG: S8 family serine peptidase [Verrucomicrobiota bacterium]
MLILIGISSMACRAASASATASHSEPLVLRYQNQKVDADIKQAELRKVLGKLSAVTGWQIFLEPKTERTVRVRFKDLPTSEALQLILGNLNYALIPQTNRPARLLVYRTSSQEATQLVPADLERAKRAAGKPIPNELIVSLKPGSGETIEQIAEKLGGKVIGKVDGFNAYRLQFEDEAAANAAREALKENSSVAGLDSNYAVDRPQPAHNLPGAGASPFSFKPKTDGSGPVVVGLIDTAVQTLDASMNSFLLSPLNVTGESGSEAPDLTHGTSMAQTILRGLASNSEDPDGASVRILPVDVYGQNPDTTTFEIAQGIYAAIRSGATIINMSMGGEGNSEFLNAIIQDAHRHGILFFGAAGNQPTTAPVFPAAYPEVVAVTAGDKRGNIAPYANRGSFVDVMGPGVTLVDFNGQPFIVTGTSAATAYVSGTAAALAASGRPPAEVETLIRESFRPPKR